MRVEVGLNWPSHLIIKDGNHGMSVVLELSDAKKSIVHFKSNKIYIPKKKKKKRLQTDMINATLTIAINKSFNFFF